MSKPRIRDPKACALYHRGHGIHWIEAMRIRAYASEEVADIVNLEDDRFSILVPSRPKPLIWFHHDPLRLSEVLFRYPTEAVKVCVDEEVIKVEFNEGSYLFSMSSKPLKPCQ